METLLELAFFFLPACLVPLTFYLSSLTFGQASVLPADLNSRWQGRPLIGKGRGLWGPAAALVIGALCGILQGRGEEGLVLALGAHMGTVFNSLLKRALGVERGRDFPPLDHIDFALGACLCYHLEYGLGVGYLVGGVLLCGVAHRFLGRGIRRALKRYEREQI